jgi:hypothetical protein
VAVLKEPVELAGHVADQAGSDLAVGLALSPSPLGIGAGRPVIAQSGQDDHVQGWSSWRSPDRLSRTRTRWPEEAGIGAAPAQHGEGGIGPAATRMGPGTQHHGGHYRAHPGGREQLSVPGPDQRGGGSGVLGGLGIQELDAASQGAPAGCGCDGLGIPGGLPLR